MPKQLISRDKIKDWSQYRILWESFPKVQVYLVGIFEQWVTTLEHPLDVQWIQDLFEGGEYINELDKKLARWEGLVGKNNLRSIFEELKKKCSGQADAIITEIYGLLGEVDAFSWLSSNRYTGLKKINIVGDWENKKAIISVKSKLDLDLNEKIIKDVLRGLFFIEENSALRDYCYINLRDGQEINDSFRKDIIEFLHNSLCEQLVKASGSFQYPIRIMHNDILVEIGPNMSKGISVSFKKIENKIIKRQLDIDFQASITGNIVIQGNISKEPSGILDLSRLSDYIKNRIENFDKSLCKIPQKDKKLFIGWINVFIHIKHEEFVKKNQEEIKRFLEGQVKKQFVKYPINFCFIPTEGFYLKDLIVFEL